MKMVQKNSDRFQVFVSRVQMLQGMPETRHLPAWRLDRRLLPIFQALIGETVLNVL